MDHARILKFSSYVHLPPLNKMIQYPYARVILCSIGDKRLLFSSMGAIFQLWNILNVNILLACINTIYKYGHAWVL